jgi:hypothetical protein
LVARRKEALVVALDWVEVRIFHTLSAVAVLPGRGVPLLWASYPEWQLHKSQNSLEEGLLRLLRTMIPSSLPVIIVADRGFGRTELAAFVRSWAFITSCGSRPTCMCEASVFQASCWTIRSSAACGDC